VALLAGCRYDPTKERADLPPIPDLQLTRISDQARSSIEGAHERVRQYPGDALLNGELGMQLHANRRFQEAAVMYGRAAKIHPEVFRWEYYLGVALTEINDVAEAGAALRRALELRENEPNAMMALAQLYFKSSKLVENDNLERQGETTLDRLIETNPDYTFGYLLKADRLEEQGKLQEAADVYKELIEKGPAFAVAHQSLARLYERQGDKPAADRELALAQQSGMMVPPSQNPWMAAVMKLGVTNMDHAARAQMFLQNRLLRPAAQEFELAVQSEPKEASHRVNLVAIYGMMNLPARAQDHYLAALRMGGADARVHLNMGTIQLAAGNLDEAEEAYNRALAGDGALAKAHMGLGRIAFQRNDLKRAESYDRQALALEPLNPIAYWELARVLRAEGRSDDAAQALEQGISYSEGKTAIRLLRSLAHLYEDKGNQAAAMNALERARVEAERSESNVDLALIDAQLGGYEGIGDLPEEP
jgi:tetratricopeptide (TPR) repeat protein